MEVKAKVRYLKTSPRKVRLVCDLIRGKKLNFALSQLKFLNKQAAKDLLVLLKSAEANAKQADMQSDKLFIEKIFADEGPVLKRTILHSRGRASQIKKRMSHVTIILSDGMKEKSVRKPKEVKKNKNIKQEKGEKSGS